MRRTPTARRPYPPRRNFATASAPLTPASRTSRRSGSPRAHFSGSNMLQRRHAPRGLMAKQFLPFVHARSYSEHPCADALAARNVVLRVADDEDFVAAQFAIQQFAATF